MKSKDSLNGIVNVVALGSSFISGAFVPQEYLGQTVLNFSKVFPSYWFIRNNELTDSLAVVNLNNLTPILLNTLVIIISG